MQVIFWIFKGIAVTAFRVPRIEVSFELQCPASFEKNIFAENNSPLRFQESCTSTVTAMNCFRIQDAVISKGTVFCLFWGAFVGSSPVQLSGSLFRNRRRGQRHDIAAVTLLRSIIAFPCLVPTQIFSFFLFLFCFCSLLLLHLLLCFLFCSFSFLPMSGRSCIGLGGLCRKGHQTRSKLVRSGETRECLSMIRVSNLQFHPAWPSPFREVPGGDRKHGHAVMQSLAKSGEPKAPLTRTFPHIHQSSSEGPLHSPEFR